MVHWTSKIGSNFGEQILRSFLPKDEVIKDDWVAWYL
jgi:hypothetical protein